MVREAPAGPEVGWRQIGAADDAAAASLLSFFCSSFALAEKKGEKVVYAAALQEAKHWVRQQPKWQSPYYWASFVLMGPI